MTKTDKSIKAICLASIKRHTMSPFDFKHTVVIEEDDLRSYPGLEAVLEQDELPVALVIEDRGSWTLVTTRRVFTKSKNTLYQIEGNNLISWDWGFFKDKSKVLSIGILKGLDGLQIPVLIENGRASMVPIYAIRTLTYINRPMRS